MRTPNSIQCPHCQHDIPSPVIQGDNPEPPVKIDIQDILRRLRNGDRTALDELLNAGVEHNIKDNGNGGYTITIKYEGTNYRVRFIPAHASRTPEIDNNAILDALENGDKTALEKLKAAGIKYELVEDGDGGFTVTYEYKGEKYCVIYAPAPEAPKGTNDSSVDATKVRIMMCSALVSRGKKDDAIEILETAGIKYTIDTKEDGSFTIKFNYDDKDYSLTFDVTALTDRIKGLVTMGSGGANAAIEELKEKGINYNYVEAEDGSFTLTFTVGNKTETISWAPEPPVEDKKGLTDTEIVSINDRLNKGDKTALDALKNAGIEYTYKDDEYGGYNVKYTIGNETYSITYAPDVTNTMDIERVHMAIEMIARGDMVAIEELKMLGIDVKTSTDSQGNTVVNFTFEDREYKITVKGYEPDLHNNYGSPYVDIYNITERLKNGDFGAISDLDMAGVNYDIARNPNGYTIIINHNNQVHIIEYPKIKEIPSRPYPNYTTIKNALKNDNKNGFTMLENAGIDYVKKTNEDGGYTVQFTDNKGVLHSVTYKPVVEPPVSEEIVESILQRFKMGDVIGAEDELRMLGLDVRTNSDYNGLYTIEFTFNGREYKVTSNHREMNNYHYNNYIDTSFIENRLRNGDTSALSELDAAGIPYDLHHDGQGYTVVFEHQNQVVMVAYPATPVETPTSRSTTQADINSVLKELRAGNKEAISKFEELGISYRYSEDGEGNFKVEYDWQGKTLSIQYNVPLPEPDISKAEVHDFIRRIANGDYMAIDILRNRGINCLVENFGAYQMVSFEYDGRSYKVPLNGPETNGWGYSGYVNVSDINTRLQHGDMSAIGMLENAGINYTISGHGPDTVVIYKYQGQVYIIETDLIL